MDIDDLSFVQQLAILTRLSIFATSTSPICKLKIVNVMSFQSESFTRESLLSIIMQVVEVSRESQSNSSNR